jgi:hypothetical protein
MKKMLLIVLITVTLSSCAYQAQLMPRNSGTIYNGDIQSNGNGSGTVSIDMGNKTCTGSYAKSATGDSFGFFETYGRRSVSVGTIQTSSDNNVFKALMTCTDGTGLRCDVQGGGNTGAGICVDSKGKVYDMIYSMR